MFSFNIVKNLNPHTSRSPRLPRNYRSGNLSALVLGGLAVTALAVFVTQFFNAKMVGVKKHLNDTRFTISVSSGIETMTLAYRAAEATYVSKACDTAAPFLQALAQGSGCPGSIDVFKGSTNPFEDPLSAGTPGLLTYAAGCSIASASPATCVTPGSPFKLIEITTAQRIGGVGETFKFYLTNINLQKDLAEFIEEATSPDGKVTKHAFAIRASLPNAAHIEADGRVSQELPNNFDICKGDPWGTYPILVGKTCKAFVELGSGTGLAFYHGRYFGFRPVDGQVIDMLAASDGSPSYLVQSATDPSPGTVDPSGTTVLDPTCLVNHSTSDPLCRVVFPSYDKDSLINVDDITVVGDQIYYVAHSGSAAHIGYLSKPGSPSNSTSNWQRFKICDLGGKGWSQAYSGIASMSWSDPLDDDDHTPLTPNHLRLARFFLKTDSGDLLTAIVYNTTGIIKDFDTSATPSTDPAQYPQCDVFKDPNLQQVEYKRTYGFERTADIKAYYLY